MPATLRRALPIQHLYYFSKITIFRHVRAVSDKLQTPTPQFPSPTLPFTLRQFPCTHKFSTFRPPQSTPTGLIHRHTIAPGPRAATPPPPHTNAPLPFCISSETPLYLFPSEQKTSRLPTTGKTAHFYVTRSGAGIGILARPTTIQTSLRSRPPGQETATLRDREHTGPQSPVDRSGPQPGRDCKACAADPSFHFRRVFSFRR